MIRRIIVKLGSSVYAGNRRLISDAPITAAPLKDKLGRRHDYLRISLTERCNLRCQYCMPAEGVPLCNARDLLSTSEMISLVEVFASLGVTKIRLTGGEPTLRQDLPEIIESLKGIEGITRVGMTSNGVVLTRRLARLQRAGLDALNISLDSLRPDRYERMARRNALPRVLACVDLALQLGYKPLKINTVLMKDFNDDEIYDFTEFTRDRDVDVRFIEFMPFSGNEWSSPRMVTSRAVLRLLAARYPHLAPLTPRPHDTSRMWQVPGHLGRVGFISSMTQPFCSSCNRLRLTADGNLKVCLFGDNEVSLRDALREGTSRTDLTRLVRDALYNKKPQHAVTSPARAQARRYCTLTHLDAAGRARMVDVSDKRVTSRRAAAACRLLASPRLVRRLRDNDLRKGDALTVAQVAGALAAKRTADLIPLCHTLALSHVHVRVTLPEVGGEGEGRQEVVVECSVATEGRTGAEMEALTGAAVAALALYDMCKAVDKEMSIEGLRLVSKSGGKSDYPPPAPPAPAAPAPSAQAQTSLDDNFAPVNIVYF